MINFAYLGKFLVSLSLTVLFLAAYIGIWIGCNKITNNKIIKTIAIGLTTPFFSFGFAVCFVSSFIYWNYTINEPSAPDTSSGALLGIVVMLGVPASIVLGIVRTIFVLMDKSIKDEVIKSLNNDVHKFFKDINSKNNQ